MDWVAKQRPRCYPVHKMRKQIFLALFLAASLQTFSQTTTTAPEGQPNDPRAILAAAAPYYDFFDPAV